MTWFAGLPDDPKLTTIAVVEKTVNLLKPDLLWRLSRLSREHWER